MQAIYLAQFKAKRDAGEGTIQNFTEGEVYFTQEEDAIAAVAIENSHKNPGLVLLPEPKEILIYESIAEYRSIADRRLRERALHKLTPAERKILGLPEK